MIRRIIETTDGKYLGLTYDDSLEYISSDGIEFKPTLVQYLGDGYVRYSNTHYAVLTKEVKHGKNNK